MIFLFSGNALARPGGRFFVPEVRPKTELMYLAGNFEGANADGTLRLLFPSAVFEYNQKLIDRILSREINGFYEEVENLEFLMGVQLRLLPFQVDSHSRQFELFGIVNPYKKNIFEVEPRNFTRGEIDLLLLIVR